MSIIDSRALSYCSHSYPLWLSRAPPRAVISRSTAYWNKEAVIIFARAVLYWAAIALKARATRGAAQLISDESHCRFKPHLRGALRRGRPGARARDGAGRTCLFTRSFFCKLTGASAVENFTGTLGGKVYNVRDSNQGRLDFPSRRQDTPPGEGASPS